MTGKVQMNAGACFTSGRSHARSCCMRTLVQQMQEVKVSSSDKTQPLHLRANAGRQICLA